MTTTKTFTSTVSLSTALKYSFYDRNKQPADKFAIIFQRLNPLVVSTVSLPNFCDKNPVATARLFQMILNCVMEALDLPDACLRAFLLDDGLTIELNFHGIAADPAWEAGSENYADMPRVGRP
jgi:hypothetical protein